MRTKRKSPDAPKNPFVQLANHPDIAAELASYLSLSDIGSLLFSHKNLEMLARAVLVNELKIICEENKVALKPAAIAFLLNCEPHLSFHNVKQFIFHAKHSPITYNGAVKFGEWLKQPEIQAISQECFWKLMARQYLGILQLEIAKPPAIRSSHQAPSQPTNKIEHLKAGFKDGYKGIVNFIVKYYEDVFSGLKDRKSNPLSPIERNLKNIYFNDKSIKLSIKNPVILYFRIFISNAIKSYTLKHTHHLPVSLEKIRMTFSLISFFGPTPVSNSFLGMVKHSLTGDEIADLKNERKNFSNREYDDFLGWWFFDEEANHSKDELIKTYGAPAAPSEHYSQNHSPVRDLMGKLITLAAYQPRSTRQFKSYLKNNTTHILTANEIISDYHLSHNISRLQFYINVIIFIEKLDDSDHQIYKKSLFDFFLHPHWRYSNNLAITPLDLIKWLKKFDHEYTKKWNEKFTKHRELIHTLLLSGVGESMSTWELILSFNQKHYEHLLHGYYFKDSHHASNQILQIIGKASGRRKIVDKLNRLKSESLRKVYDILEKNWNIFYRGLYDFNLITVNPKDNAKYAFQAILRTVKIPDSFSKTDIEKLLAISTKIRTTYPYEIGFVRTIFDCEAPPVKILGVFEQINLTKIQNLPLKELNFWIGDCDVNEFKSIPTKLLRSLNCLSYSLLKQFLVLYKQQYKTPSEIKFVDFLKLCRIYNKRLAAIFATLHYFYEFNKNIAELANHATTIGQLLALQRAFDYLDGLTILESNQETPGVFKFESLNIGYYRKNYKDLSRQLFTLLISEATYKVTIDTLYHLKRNNKRQTKKSIIDDLYQKNKDTIEPIAQHDDLFMLPPTSSSRGNKEKRKFESSGESEKSNKRRKINNNNPEAEKPTFTASLKKARELLNKNPKLNQAELQAAQKLTNELQAQLQSISRQQPHQNSSQVSTQTSINYNPTLLRSTRRNSDNEDVATAHSGPSTETARHT